MSAHSLALSKKMENYFLSVTARIKSHSDVINNKRAGSLQPSSMNARSLQQSKVKKAVAKVDSCTVRIFGHRQLTILLPEFSNVC